MAAKDELEEINGLKPKVWLQDGEEREVNSQSRYAVALTRRLEKEWLILSFFLTTAIQFTRSNALLTIFTGELSNYTISPIPLANEHRIVHAL